MNGSEARRRVPVILRRCCEVVAGLVPAIHVLVAEALQESGCRDNPRIKATEGMTAR